MPLVELTPMGNKIKYQIKGTVLCFKGGEVTQLRNSGVYSRHDLIWLNIFSKLELKKFIKNNKKIIKKLELHQLGYSSCDRLKQNVKFYNK